MIIEGVRLFQKQSVFSFVLKTPEPSFVFIDEIIIMFNLNISIDV